MAGTVLEVEAIPAASVLVLRDDPFELLMLRRSGASSFVPNAWVFPGGIAEPHESDLRLTAVRETFEEAGLTLNAEELVWTSRWITPVGLPKRFDTYFYLARVGREVEVTIDGREVVEALWISPADALQRRRELNLVFPTIKNLEAIAGFTDAGALLESRRGAVIEPVQPVLVNGKPTLP
ncbi:MAG TPA: NUDIX hydrolase [Solirubrobacterales bacterium]|nr:NUDIX hydrolase [Solirubrobacterales bacterium]